MRALLSLAESSAGTWGGLTRFRALARALVRSGHEVAFLAPDPLAGRLAAEGFRTFATPAGTFFGLPRRISDRLVSRRADAVPPVREGRDFGSIWLVSRIEGFADRDYLSRLVGMESEVVARFRPDVLVPNLDLALFLVGHIRAVPVATMFSSVKLQGVGSLSWRRVAAVTGRVLHEYGAAPVRPERLCYGHQVLKIVPSVPELEDLDPGAEDICFVGPLSGGGDHLGAFEAEEGRRYLMVYLGTGAVPFSQVRSVIPELMVRCPDHVAVVASQAVQTPFSRGNVVFTDWVDAERLLPHCDASICHGGLNSVVQALVHDVPVVAFPGPVFERRYNARKVVSAGAGAVGERTQFTPEWLGRTLSQRGTFLPGATRLGALLRAAAGADGAVRALERFAATASHGRTG